jgi:hypothetical protein
MNRSDAPPASTINKITWSRYVALDSLISLPVLAGGVDVTPLYSGTTRLIETSGHAFTIIFSYT